MIRNDERITRLESIMKNDAMSYTGRLAVVAHDKELFDYVYQKTSFLVDSEETTYPLTTRINFVLSGLSAIPLCPTCGATLKFLKSKNRFQHHCCPRCAVKDKETQRKRVCTCMDRYGATSFNNHEKQKATMLSRYGIESALCKSEFRDKGANTKEKRYGSSTYNNPTKTTLTCEERYGIGNGRNYKKAEKTMESRYGVKTYLLSEEVNAIRNNETVQRKIQETKRIRHTFRASSLEEECYHILMGVFGKEDVVRQYKSAKYPYLCDFYIPSKDLYIEFNGHWSHGKHAFDNGNKEDLQIADKWRTRGTRFYLKALWVWTEYDVEKRKIASREKINRKEFWTITELKEYLKGERL